MDAGRPSQSHVRLLESGPGEALVEVEIASGRPHQVRIHLAAAGFPLKGDPLYAEGGRVREGCMALPGDGGYALHAVRLAVAGPSPDGPRIDVSCRPPANLFTSAETLADGRGSLLEP